MPQPHIPAYTDHKQILTAVKKQVHKSVLALCCTCDNRASEPAIGSQSKFSPPCTLPWSTLWPTPAHAKHTSSPETPPTKVTYDMANILIPARSHLSTEPRSHRPDPREPAPCCSSTPTLCNIQCRHMMMYADLPAAGKHPKQNMHKAVNQACKRAKGASAQHRPRTNAQGPWRPSTECFIPSRCCHRGKPSTLRHSVLAMPRP